MFEEDESAPKKHVVFEFGEHSIDVKRIKSISQSTVYDAVLNETVYNIHIIDFMNFEFVCNYKTKNLREANMLFLKSKLENKIEFL
jgi:hypothetical protein